MDILLQQIINGLVLGSIYALIALGCYLVARAVMAVHRIDRRVNEIKERSRELAALID